ncbi:MAG: SRPBCC domain-containing protein [Acidimicrobiales bacterium]
MATPEHTVEREIRIEASPETVFAFFTDPARMVAWKGIDAKLDPVPGGTYRVDMNGRDVARGEYVEVDPPNRVVFTWGWEADGNPVPPGSSTVEVTFRPDGAATIVRLVHRDLPIGAEAPHAEGWDHYLARLAVAGVGDNPGPDPWIA